MSNFFENLYKDFLLRDILAKAVPGFLLLGYFLQGKMPTVLPENEIPDIVVIIVLYGLSFMTGMLLQYLGAKFRLIRIYVHDNDQEKTLKKLHEFLDATKNERENFRSQRERFVILKNMSGTYAIAFLTIALIEFVKYFGDVRDPIPMTIAVLFIFFLVLRGQNHFHANEQKIWEDKIIKGEIKAELREKK